jgi:hypothetical protein
MGSRMMQVVGSACCVCGNSDSRALAEIELAGTARVVLCGTHALMYQRSKTRPSTESELRALLRDRRGRRDRRHDGDELGAALTAAFGSDRRGADRRHAG